MTTPTFNIGDLHQCEITFYDLADVPADPSTITFTMTKPDGTKLLYTFGSDAELIKVGTGVYKVTVIYDQTGRHIAKWTGEGDVHLVRELETYVVETS